MMSLILLPILLPLIGAALSLLLRKWRHAQLAVGFAALGGALVAMGILLVREETIVFQLGSWAPPMGITLVGDALSLLFVVMSLFVMVFGLVYVAGSKDKCVRFPIFVPLYLALSAGLCGGILTGDVFNLFVFAELLAIATAVVTATSDDKRGVEAAWKYFYISTFAGLLMLAGCGCLYAGYGTLNMADLSTLIAADTSHPLLRPGAAMLLCAMLIKAAAVPFHFWQPDVYTTAPTAASAVLAGVVVKFGVYGVIRLGWTVFFPLLDLLLPVLIAAGFAGIVLGGFAAIGTGNLKRVLAYSSPAQVGVLFVALGLGSAAGMTAALVFAVNHAVIKSSMLMVAGAMASRAPGKSADFSAMTGVGRGSPWGGYLFVLGAMALVGMPPMNGFVSKWLVIVAAAAAPRWAVVLVVAICLSSALTLLYAFRSYARVWWEPLPEGARVRSGGDSLLAPACLLGVALVLGVVPGPLFRAAERATALLEAPAAYRSNVMPETANSTQIPPVIAPSEVTR